MTAPIDTVRSFVALYPDAEALRGMGGFIACMRGRNRTIRWERDAQVHITLKFLGDVERTALSRIERELRERFSPSQAFGAVCDRVGAFPSLRRPRIVWLGFSQPVPEIMAMQAVIEDVCAGAGVEREAKPFTPHFTVGRVKPQSSTGGLEKEIEACSFQAVQIRFAAVKIMKSELTPQGAIHTVVADIPLQPGEYTGNINHQRKD